MRYTNGHIDTDIDIDIDIAVGHWCSVTGGEQDEDSRGIRWLVRCH